MEDGEAEDDAALNAAAAAPAPALGDRGLPCRKSVPNFEAMPRRQSLSVGDELPHFVPARKGSTRDLAADVDEAKRGREGEQVAGGEQEAEAGQEAE